MLDLSETGSALVAANKEATKGSASIIAGNVINNRLAKIIAPKLPVMVRGYAETQLGKAALANMVAGVLIHTMPQNEKAMIAANAMIASANLTLAQSFNIEEMIDDLLDGVSLDGIAPTKESADWDGK